MFYWHIDYYFWHFDNKSDDKMSKFLTISDHWAALAIAIVLTAVSQLLLRSGAKELAGSLSMMLLNFRILLGYLFFIIVVILMNLEIILEFVCSYALS